MAMKLQTFCLKLSLYVSVLLFCSLDSNAQIDSAFVQVNFTEYIDPISADTIDYMHTQVDVFPITNFGSISIEVMETSSGSPTAQLVMTYDELVLAGLLSGNTIAFIAEYIDPELDYTIETIIRTDRGAHSPKIITYYEAP
jgi:hypothetical protein